MRLLAPVLALVLLAPLAQAWVAGPDRPHHADLAEAAAQRLPAEWRDLLMRERDAFRQGALDPDGITDPDASVHTFYHAYEPADGGGGGVYRVRLSLHEATMALREGKSERDVAYQMGFLTHFISDLAMPFHTGADAYDHVHHEAYEKLAYDHRGEYALGDAPAPREVTDVEAYAIEVAERSAALAPRLVASVEASEGAWSEDGRAIAEESAALAVTATADMLYTAFAMADPARPEPEFTVEMPVPTEPEDVGLSLTELRKHHPFALAALGFAAAAATVAVFAFFFARRIKNA